LTDPFENKDKKMNRFEEGLLHYLSREQLRKIHSVKIGIGGAGGIGSNIVIILARCGFKHFEILDYDLIEESNLNRQQFFIGDIGTIKVDSLKKFLISINPDIHLISHLVKWEAPEADRYFRDCDYIVEAFDQAAYKKAFVEYYQDKAKAVISGNGMAGLKKKKPLLVKKMENIYLVGDLFTDGEQGHPPLAPRVTACAAMMAEIILDLVLE
jgi:sulfur carrier protein ThiS adenylyltransferase